MLEDYRDYIDKFKCVDLSDDQSVLQWFKSHPYLSVHDHAIIMGKSIATVRKLKYKVGIKGRPPSKIAKPFVAKHDHIEVVPDWRFNRQWLQDNINLYGASAVARSIGIARNNLYTHLKKLNIKLVGGHKSKNPCCSKAWCYHHYVELGYSANKCAKLANITRPKFLQWLIKFSIPILKAWEQRQFHKFTLNLRIAIAKLKAHPAVRKVYIKKMYLIIAFKYGVKTRLPYSLFNNEDWRLSEILEPVNEYEKDILDGDDFKAHITLSKEKYYRLNRFEKTISLHNFSSTLVRRGWSWPQYPNSVLVEDYNKLLNIKESQCIKGNAFSAIHCGAVGKRLMIQYFDLSSYFEGLYRQPRNVFQASKKFLKTRHKKVNTTNLILSLNNKLKTYPALKLAPPALFKNLFRKLRIKSVLDLHVEHGAHAIGSALVGIDYYHLDDHIIDLAISKGFKDRFQDFKPFNYTDEIIDLVLCDKELNEGDIEAALKYAKYARQILAFVSRDNRKEYELLYKPRSIIKIITKLEPDYFFLW